jgi:hypothetical protein
LTVVVLALGFFGGFMDTIVFLISLAKLLIIPILFSLYLHAQFMERVENSGID